MSIDSDLEHLSRYIELSELNYKVYSIELLRMYLSICSEIDSLMKKICVAVDQKEYFDVCGRNPNMDTYRNVIQNNYPLFFSVECSIPEFNLLFQPWKSFVDDKNPKWWQDHNSVKHNRYSNFQRACLGNVLDAAAGLLIVLIYDLAGKGRVNIDDLTRPKMYEIPPRLDIGGVKWVGSTLNTPESIEAEKRKTE